MIAARYGWMAFICAVLLHILALGLLVAAPSEGAKAEGDQGVEIDLGMLGSMGDALDTTEETAAELPEELPKELPEEVPEALPKEVPAEVPAEVPPKPEPEPEPIKPAGIPEPPKQQVSLKVKKALDIDKKRVQVTSKKVTAEAPPSRQQAPTSVAQKKASSGAANAPTTGGDPGVERSYFALLAATLAKNKRYPAASRRRGEEGVVVLTFTVDRLGGISAAQIKTSSGYARLDRAVLRMLESARRLPAFPVGMRQTQLLINIPIAFELNPRH
jgi:protein TonB